VKENKKIKENKENKPNKFLEIIKKKWLIDGTRTTILVLAIVAIFVGLSVWMHNLDLTPIDFSQEKLYTLTDESKEKIKDIDKDVHIYFVGYDDSDSNLSLAKQYKDSNEKIVAEAVNINNRPDLANKYGLETGSKGIIVESGEKSKVLTDSDLVTYDTSTYETISIAEEKLTSSIISVTSNKIPKIYFLEGYSDYTLSKNMNYLNIYLQNEINEIEKLNVLQTGKIPDDCDTLVITTPSKDFDDVATNAITNYINSGKNILWLNAAISEKIDLPNVNKILETYGVKPFETGIIRETDTKKMIAQLPELILPEIQYATVTKDLYNSTGVIFVNATKINLIDDKELEEKNITKTELAKTSEGAYFRTNFETEQDQATEGEEKQSYLVGAELEKTIKEEESVTSKLVIIGENIFITDYQLMQNSQSPAIELAQNKDLVLNALAYLVDRQEDITARKSTGTVTYTATEQQDTIIRIIIFAVPALIVIAGLIVWQKRRRKK